MLVAFTTALLCAAAAPQEDALVLTNGKVQTVRRIKAETFKEVIYQTTGGGESRKASEDVLEVRHNLTAKQLTEFADAVDAMEIGEFGKAATLLDGVLVDQALERSSFAWVRQHALYRQARCFYAMARPKDVTRVVDSLLTSVPDTFFYAPALMVKAESLKIAGQDAQAKAVFEQLASEVANKGLPERWLREAELGQALLDKSLRGKAKERLLAGLAEKNNANFPTVASRANVEIGNVMVSSKEYDKAQGFFERIVKGGSADEMTLAGAYAGLGDCHYYRAQGLAGTRQRDEYERAALNHLRVITMHQDAIALVPRSHYHAAVALRNMKQTETIKQARQLASRLKRLYPQSPWWTKLAQEWQLR